MLDPNSAVPAFRRKPACDQADATGHAAGVVYVAPNGDVLLLHRSGDEENFKHHWALPGGGVDEGETPSQGAARESREEMGYDADEPKKLLDQRRTPNGKVFHTFVQPVSEKFAPKLNDEHTGYTWAPLNALPGPLHPAVQATFDERVGVAKDMSPEDWAGLRDGFLKWTAEEESEGEHADDEVHAADGAPVLAVDEESVRTKSTDGHLHIKKTPISKACVNPYRGKEIPGFKQLGLEPDKIYHLLRDPDELKRAAATSNGKPFLRKHIPATAKDHATKAAWDTIGATGSDAVYEHPYLYNSLAVWPAEDIEDIESEAKKELSSAYRYTPDMTPGDFDGKRYDGVMRDIGFNHVALVKDGRAGPDVFVHDSMEGLMAGKATRIGAFTLQMVAAHAAPFLAMDQKLTLSKDLFTPITSANLAELKPKLLAGVRSALDGKLAKGLALDASMEHIGKVMDNVSGLFGGKGADESATEEQHKAMEAAASGNSDLGIPKSVGAEYVSKDAEPLAAMLREKGMDEDFIKKACDMFPKNGMGAKDESPEEKEKREKAEAEKKAKDEADEEAEKEKGKQAMDSAITAAVETAIKGERANAAAVRSAIHFVTPWVGTLSPDLAMDSAEQVLHHACKALGVKGHEQVKDPIALRAMIDVQPKPGARPSIVPPKMAMDAKTKDMSKDLGLDRIKVG